MESIDKMKVNTILDLYRRSNRYYNLISIGHNLDSAYTPEIIFYLSQLT